MSHGTINTLCTMCFRFNQKISNSELTEIFSNLTETVSKSSCGSKCHSSKTFFCKTCFSKISYISVNLFRLLVAYEHYPITLIRNSLSFKMNSCSPGPPPPNCTSVHHQTWESGDLIWGVPPRKSHDLLITWSCVIMWEFY